MSKFTKTDKLSFKYLVAKRGHICEIHGKECSNIGTMHILSKNAYPRLRYDDENRILAGWFCSHYYTHHNPDDKRAIYAKQRICEIRGYKTWQELLDALKVKSLSAPKVDLKMLNLFYSHHLSGLERI